MTCTTYDDLDRILGELPCGVWDEAWDALEFVVLEQVDNPADVNLIYFEGKILGALDENTGRSFFKEWRQRLYREGVLA